MSDDDVDMDRVKEIIAGEFGDDVIRQELDGDDVILIGEGMIVKLLSAVGADVPVAIELPDHSLRLADGTIVIDAMGSITL